MQSNKIEKEVIDYEARKKISKEAIRTLLDQIRQGEKNNTPIVFSARDIQNAKEFFSKWKEERIFYKKFPVTIGLVVIFGYLLNTNFFGFLGSIGIVISYLFAFTLFEHSSTKCVYVREIAGDMSSYSIKERERYIEGIKSELWIGNDKCELNYIKVAISTVVLLSLTVAQHFVTTLELHQQLSMFSAISLGVINKIKFFKD